MAERLSNLAHAQSLSSTTVAPHPPGFNPRSISFDIRSPEELAAVNEFLITLGRNVTGGPVSRQAQNSAEYQAPQSYFDAQGLRQLGLAGMPGIPSGPGSGAGYHGDVGYGSSAGINHHLPEGYPSRTSHPSVQPVQYGSLYPSLPESQAYPSPPYAGDMRRASLSPRHDMEASSFGGPQFQPASVSHFSIPQQDLVGGASPVSSHSARSTPPTGTPPHLAESFVSFDYVRPSRAPAAVQLDPVDYASRTLRQVTLLRTAPGANLGKPEPMEPRLPSGPVRGPPARLTSATSSPSASTSLGSLYPLLKTTGDAQYKLPPLQHKYRSPSPLTTPTMSPLSRASTISPPPSMDVEEDHSSGSATPEPMPQQLAMLPGIRTLTREVGRIALESRIKAREVSEVERSRHAELLRDMLVNINGEYKRRYGTPPPSRVPRGYEQAMERERTMSPSRDVEMVAAC